MEERVICKMPLSFYESETSKDPVEILRKLMAQPFCPMHGPVHHVLVGAALLTAYRNAGGKINLEAALEEMEKRAECVPGGACGNWGACGAGISTGMFVSLAVGSGPLKTIEWPKAMKMTSRALERIASTDGPRCCKRDSYSAILSAIEYSSEVLGVEMDRPDVKCIHSGINSQCIKEKCPYYNG